MYELIVNGETIAENLPEAEAVARADKYCAEHHGEDIRVLIRRQEGKC